MMKKKELLYNVFLLITLCSFVYAADTPSYPITQEDIQNGLIITQSGLWILQEDVTFNQQYAIVVNVANVVIDLNGYVIDGTNQGQTAIRVSNESCLIRNGVIQGAAGA